jgi:hypothetical protein
LNIRRRRRTAAAPLNVTSAREPVAPTAVAIGAGLSLTGSRQRHGICFAISKLAVRQLAVRRVAGAYVAARPAPAAGVQRRLEAKYRTNQMNDDSYLALQVCILCTLLFLVGVTAVAQHPEWFG